MAIKSDLGAAVLVGGNLLAKANSGNQEIQYAEESNLTAVSSGKIQGKQANQLFGQYKSLLSGDAERIGSLGAEFDAIDKKIAQQVNQHL